MHKNNKHKKGYNFKELTQAHSALETFVFVNDYNSNETIDFANPEAVKALNVALLKSFCNIDFWKFPDAHLCPPIPGRVEYIHHLNDLLKPYKLKDNIRVLDVGIGATCIYPLLGHSEYNWSFVGTDIDPKSLANAQMIIDKNGLSKVVELRLQTEKSLIFTGIIEPTDRFALSMCNPPFYRSEQEALEAAQRKMKGLGNASPIRNFSGTANEVEVGESSGTITIGLPDNVTIAGNLTVSGTQTTVSSTTVTVADPMLSLATNNGSADAVDIPEPVCVA